MISSLNNWCIFNIYKSSITMAELITHIPIQFPHLHIQLVLVELWVKINITNYSIKTIKTTTFGKQSLECLSFVPDRQQYKTFDYKIIHRIPMCNEWLKNITIKICKTCSFRIDIDTISDFVIDCNSNKLFWKSWAKWWEAMTGFNIREESYIH